MDIAVRTYTTVLVQGPNPLGLPDINAVPSWSKTQSRWLDVVDDAEKCSVPWLQFTEGLDRSEGYDTMPEDPE